jgi:hypothetical protein
MIIDNDLEVEIGDGVAVFDEPSLRDWAVMEAMSGKSLEEQADIILPKLKEVRGFQYKDGTDVTIEDLRNKKFSAKFFLTLIRAWTNAIVSSIRVEGEEKKEEMTH